MRYIISKINSGNRLEDMISAILESEEAEFEFILKDLGKGGGMPLYFYYEDEFDPRPGVDQYPPKEYFPMEKILEELKNRKDNSKGNSREQERISKILSCRNFDSFKLMYSKKYEISESLINAVFEILGDEGKFNRFINFADNTEEFSIDGEKIAQSEYLKCMATIFGKKHNKNSPFSGYDITNQDIYIQRYRELYDRVNLERYANPKYEFREWRWCTTIRKGDEPDWSVHPKVVKEVNLNMPEMLSPEERAIWIYLKLCKMFSYDEGYEYKDLITNSEEGIPSLKDLIDIGIAEEGKIESVNYTTKFSKKHLESILPGAKITCFDFARIYFQLVNECKENISAVIVPEGLLEKHFLNGIYNDRISATFDSISNEVAEDGMNDLMKVKSGIQIGGVKAIYDPDNILGQAIERLYPLIIGREPITIEAYRAQLKEQVNESSGKRKRTNYNYRFD